MTTQSASQTTVTISCDDPACDNVFVYNTPNALNAEFDAREAARFEGWTVRVLTDGNDRCSQHSDYWPGPQSSDIMRKATERGWEVEIDERIPHQVNITRTDTGEAIIIRTSSKLGEGGTVIEAYWRRHQSVKLENGQALLMRLITAAGNLL